jgi:hypothetical protein
MVENTLMQSSSHATRTIQNNAPSRTRSVQASRCHHPRFGIFRGGNVFFSTATGIASRHVPRLALAMMVLFAHPHAGRASLRQTTAGTQSRHRSLSHHAPRRGATLTTVGDRVVAYVSTLQGRQVGDGECFSLVDNALSANGLRSAAAYGEITPDADYVWGRPVSLTQVQPGDVLQFRNFRIVKRITTTQQMPGGQLARTESEDFEERDHHTAIVERNFGDSVSIFEQNVEPEGRVVQRNRIALKSHTENETNAAESSQNFIQISVEGEVFAYRPQRATRAEMAQIASSQSGTGLTTRN